MPKKIFFLLLYLCSMFHINAQDSRHIDSIRRLIPTYHEDKKLAYLNDLLARSFLEINPDSVVKYANRSLTFSEHGKIYPYQVDAHNTLGMVARKKGDYEKSLACHFDALKIAKAHKLESHYFHTTYSSIALAYTEQGNYTPAIEYSYKALHEIEIQKDTLNVALANNNLANIFFEIKNYDKALIHYEKALALARQLSHLYGQGLITANIGSVFYETGKLDSAKVYFDESLKIAIEIEDLAGEGLNYLNLGSYYHKKKQYAQAIENFLKAEKIFSEQEMDPDLSTVYYNMADVYTEQGDYKKAVVYGEKSLTLANKIQGRAQQESAHQVLTNVYDKLHKTAEAYSHYKSYIAIRDSIYSEDNKKAQFKVELEYEYVKKRYADSLDQVMVTRIQEEALGQERLRTETQRKFTYAAMFGCLLLLLLAVFIFKGYRDKQKANRIITLQKHEVEHQKEVIEEKQKEILDSIHYAKRIQSAVIASPEYLSQHLREHFILFKPKDIVSGDFYWATESNGRFYLAVCDSTGHGVPGAFMSLLNTGFMSEAIIEKNISGPEKVFDYVRQRLTDSIGREEQKDGFDGILLCIDKAAQTITYAAANNEPVLISGEQLIYPGYDKMPVGKGEHLRSFQVFTVTYKPGDMLYLYTDGYADQFGGPSGKKFKYRQLEELILSIHPQSMQKQEEILRQRFEAWRGQQEQVDDVLVMGIRL
ncbi:MAG: tetratricopeptide repeat protein [Bacteroidetes bacterium]|nr:tetratricopeptide repeat protein [Bacteroidota bacterium]